jgi:hypothetical protein
MKSPKEKMARIEAALAKAHRQQEETEIPPDWREKLMGEIRQTAFPAPTSLGGVMEAPVFQRICLPFAAVAGLGALALYIYSSQAGSSLEYGLLSLGLNDPTGLLKMLWF